MTIQQYTRPPWKWCMYNFVIFFFIIIAIISVFVQLLHNDSHSRYFVTQEQLKCIKTNKQKSILSEIKYGPCLWIHNRNIEPENFTIIKTGQHDRKKYLNTVQRTKYIIIILQCDKHQLVRLSDHWWVFIFLFFLSLTN